MHISDFAKSGQNFEDDKFKATIEFNNYSRALKQASNNVSIKTAFQNVSLKDISGFAVSRV